jgi:hypothetical protein
MTEREEGQGPMADGLDRALWLRCRQTEAPEDEAARLLDLAAFADGTLDTDEAERVAALLADDPDAAADVAAARALTATATPAAFDRIVGRAAALAPPAAGRRVVPFALGRRRRPLLPQAAQWASLAAAVVLASWLGFAMGNDFSLDYSDSQMAPSAGDEAGTYLPELLDPSTGGLLHDFAEDLQT